MKVYIFFAGICLLIFASCQKKGLPVITQRTDEPKKEPLPVTIAPDTIAGKSVFMNRCARCHDLPPPGQYTASRWEGILSSMMPKARLNREQEVHITAYLKANAAK